MPLASLYVREVATILRTHCRPADEAVRYAGDEFVLFLRADAEAGRAVDFAGAVVHLQLAQHAGEIHVIEFVHATAQQAL